MPLFTTRVPHNEVCLHSKQSIYWSLAAQALQNPFWLIVLVLVLECVLSANKSPSLDSNCLFHNVNPRREALRLINMAQPPPSAARLSWLLRSPTLLMPEHREVAHKVAVGALVIAS